ncbi:hypothetical protein [Brevundimonas lutea]|uniref:hypothetical protein n=1 Tax=Brevundimonas lutea TaxID=2293980 RepID=UPI000F019A46|nr:hypothetical protein [Brevundimonas lutea]
MPHQNVSSSNATAQNQATDPVQPNDRADASAPREPRSYVDQDWRQASVAAPAAGELADDMDEGDAVAAEGLQQGRNHVNRPERTEASRGQGPKTAAANRDQLKGDR